MLHSSTLPPSAADLDFLPDELGEGFGHYFLELGADPDGESPIRCTLVRYCPDSANDSFFSLSLIHI